MSFERSFAGTGIGAEPGPNAGPADAGHADVVTPAMRLQILSTEHWSLLASRALAWNESFSRAGMFLTTLTGAIVALALVAQASAFGDAFTLFALVILPVVLFIGVATSIRLGASNYHEAICVIGMNRIRAAYLELAPDLERFFVMSAHDDLRGMGITMGVQPGGGRLFWLAQIIAGTPTVVTILNSVLAGVIAAVVALRLGANASTVLGIGLLGFVLAETLQILYASRRVAKVWSGLTPRFPTPVAKP
ncbi:MAG: hypothetical protein AUI83_01055 [Armatimonadetes bacterium 13_1_40CM_3_65_7]|nr:MAG: hypothetical protein AUI83_01055 [Armatimonadetes bacterium 13_1_40CM_3_65_7]